jgi:hypothetical protein
MASMYPELSSDYDKMQRLQQMGIDVFEPQTKFEESMARTFSEFSSYVLFRKRDKCLEILESDLHNGAGSVGELQGGDDSFSIYRVSFPDNDESTNPCKKSKNAAEMLLQEFNNYSQEAHRHNYTMLTFDRIKQYMLGMCDRRTNERYSTKYSSLRNLMFILCFGEAAGQVRHIDNMLPNVQICLYMSASCPSTIVYEMDDGDGPPVTDVSSLLDLWSSQNKSIPQMIVDVLQNHQDSSLKNKWYTKYFGFWKTINQHLLCFGKLYQPVLYQLSLQTDPGTTMLAGGNEVHAGPPTAGPRMFAFAVGIPDPDEEATESGEVVDDDNDGEVQYSPVLLHIDFCCLLFSLLDNDCNLFDLESVVHAKHFLLDVLVELIRDYPMKEYLRQINEDRIGIRDWLEKVLWFINQNSSVDSLIYDATRSDQIFYSPDVAKQNLKKKKKERHRVRSGC